jgi:hypothetical protein
MRGHIIAEDKFMHQGIDHHLFITQADGAENEYRFEVRRIAPGGDHPETIYEKTEDLTRWVERDPKTDIGELLCDEITIIKKEIFVEEDLHANDP